MRRAHHPHAVVLRTHPRGAGLHCAIIEAIFKAIELDAGSRQRTGRELVLDYATRTDAIADLLAALGVAPDAAVVDPSRTLVRIGQRLWTIVAVAAGTSTGTVSPTLRRAGAKHKHVR